MKKREVLKIAERLDKLSTGEPDQDYDHEFFDEIVNQLDQAGFPGATHREFDKYQGVYLQVPGVDKFWIDDIGYSGERTDEETSYKYQKVVLEDIDGDEYSATKGDYFQLPPDYVFDGNTLVLTLMDGTQKRIDDPKLSDFPNDSEVSPLTYSLKKETIEEHYTLYPESDPETKIEIIMDPSGVVLADELITYCEANGA